MNSQKAKAYPAQIICDYPQWQIKTAKHEQFEIRKKHIQNSRHTIFRNIGCSFILWTLFLLSGFVVQAQDKPVKYDEILLKNGVEYIGTIKEIDDKQVKFSHKDETLVYTIGKDQIFRIAFASGRTEIFSLTNKEENAGGGEGSRPMNKNMLAILPFRYTSNKPTPGWSEMKYQIQEEAYVLARSNIYGYELQDPKTTNALLLKKGIDPQQLRAYTLDEIANLLGVGLVMSGEVQMQATGMVSTSTQSVYQNNNTNKPNYNNQTTTVVSNNNYKETFNTKVVIYIHRQDGSLIFNRGKESVWNVPDAYKATLAYLLKRTNL